MANKQISVVQTDLALVLQAVPYKEADLMLSLFTRTDGLHTVRAYGARSLKSKIRAACQPFVLSEFEFYVKGERYSVREAAIRRQFANLETDYASYSSGCLILELTRKVLVHAYEFEDLFVLVIAALTALDRKDVPARDVLLFFLLRLVHQLGVFPVLKSCCICGNPVGEVGFWSSQEGGAVCKSCAKTISVQTGLDRAITLIGSFGRGQIAQLGEKDAQAEDVLEAIDLLLDYLQVQYQLKLRTRKSLRL